MKIGFVCNQNLARSQVLSGFFSRILPTHSFFSFGLIAQENLSLPVTVELIMDEWGLNSYGRHARNLNLHWGAVKDLDLIFALTTSIAEHIQQLGFSGGIFDIAQHAEELGINVFDPQLMPRRQVAYELAKYLKVSVSAFRKLGLLTPFPESKAYLPETDLQVDQAIELAIAESKRAIPILLADLVAPSSSRGGPWEIPSRDFSTHSRTRVFDLLESTQQARLFKPVRASMNPSRDYLSANWLNFLEELGSVGLILITPPIRNSSGMIPESYLAALFTERFHILPG